MHKDSFFYIFKVRLEYANDYAKDCSDWLRRVKVQDKGDKEFQKNKIVRSKARTKI